MTKEEREKTLRLCANDLVYFGKTITPKQFYLPVPEFHKELAGLLMDRTNEQVLIQAPRGFSKSTYAVLMVLHHIIFDDGDKTIVIQSKTQPEAISRLATIKKILNYSTRFKRLFGEGGEVVAESWTEKKIKSKIGGNTFTIKAIGTGMPARGVLESGVSEDENGEIEIDTTRITLYLLDDPDDEDSCLTVEQMNKNFGKFTANIQGMDKRMGRVLVIGTPVEVGCIVDMIARNPVGWVVRVYKAYWDEDGARKYLWEEMRDQKWLDDKREELKEKGKLSKFYSEYLCTLKKGEDIYFKGYHKAVYSLFFQDQNAFVKITKIDDVVLDPPKIIAVNTFLGIDPASSTADGACHSVTFSIAYDANKNWYVLPYFRKRVPPLAHAEQIIESIRNYKYSYASVETVNYQLFLRDYLRQLLTEEDLYVTGLERKWNPHVGKDERLETMEPMFSTGHVYIMENMQELEDEFEMFPNGTKDLLDGMYYSTRKPITPYHILQEQPDPNIFFLPRKREQKVSWMSR